MSKAKNMNSLIMATEQAARECRVLWGNAKSYRAAREYVLDTAGALADRLEEKAAEYEAKQ